MRITREEYQAFLKQMRRYGHMSNPTEVDMAIVNNNRDVHQAFIGTNIKAIEI